MSELEHDKEFEAYLVRRSVVHGRLASQDDLEPPRELDRIVLAKAREAIEMPRQLPIYAGARWALPVALAATLVLSFAILLHFGLVPAPMKSERYEKEAGMPLTTDVAEIRIAPTASPPAPQSRAAVQSARARDAIAATTAVSGTDDANEAQDPAAWLRRIEQLRAAGKTEAAERELRDFRKAWPDHPVPAELNR